MNILLTLVFICLFSFKYINRLEEKRKETCNDIKKTGAGREGGK